MHDVTLRTVLAWERAAVDDGLEAGLCLARDSLEAIATPTTVAQSAAIA